MRISVLIATRNRPAALRRCLASIAQQRRAALAEVLVLDDASSPPLDEADLHAAVPDLPLRLLRTEAPEGIPGGRNRLMRAACGDILCVLDDDAALASPAAFEHLTAAFETNPCIDILAFKILQHRGSSTSTATPHGRRMLRRAPHLAERPGLVAHYIGCGHALHKRLLARCGGYPDAFFVGHEELDLSYRVLDTGGQIMYTPHIVVHHYPAAPALEKTSNRRLELYYYTRNRLWLAYRYLPWPQAAVHMGVWLTRYGAEALRDGTLSAYGRGVLDGMAGFARAGRRPLRPSTLDYLKKHYGRVWF